MFIWAPRLGNVSELALVTVALVTPLVPATSNQQGTYIWHKVQ